MILSKELVLSKIKLNKTKLFDKYPIKSLGIFGSYSRGDATEDSDIDILVEFSEPVGFEFIDLSIDLETILAHRIDLVSKKALKSSLLSFIEKDVIYV